MWIKKKKDKVIKIIPVNKDFYSHTNIHTNGDQVLYLSISKRLSIWLQ